MLFAAGRGTRLRPLTDHTPKPLVEVGGRPLLAWALSRFGAHGLERVVVNTHHLAEQVRNYLATQHYPFELCLSHEPELLETGGGLVHARALLGDEPFFCANADTLWIDTERPALARLEQAFDPARMDALLLLQPLERAVGYSGPGNFELAADGALQRRPDPSLVFTGLQILSPRLLSGERPRVFSLRELYDAATGPDGTLRRVHGLVHDGDWVHVGTPHERAEAERYLALKRRP